MIKVDEDRCTGCGACINACPFGAISMMGSKAKIEEDLCRGCMICARYCGEGAIVAERAGEKTEEVKRKLEKTVEELETGKISCERVEELEGVVTLLKNECIANSGAQRYSGEEYRYDPGPGGGYGFGRRYRRR
ncbi:MAG: 4Fe-4S binding protein [Candidatus Thermoplasmatota archaeon]|nr:4Fe-4S binding protein [Candidatus Thermoplasmatota archaeon]